MLSLSHATAFSCANHKLKMSGVNIVRKSSCAPAHIFAGVAGLVGKEETSNSGKLFTGLSNTFVTPISLNICALQSVLKSLFCCRQDHASRLSARKTESSCHQSLPFRFSPKELSSFFVGSFR